MRRVAAPLAAFLLYLGFALILFAPVLGHFATHCLSHPQGELPMKLWDQWRASEGLLADRALPVETKLVDFPQGGTLFPSDPFNSLVFLPVYAGFGPAARFNASPLVHLVFAAMAAFFLALYLTRSPGGALVAGTAFGFSPFLLTYGVESGCSEALCVGWFPLLLLFLLRTFRERSPVNPVLAGSSAFLLVFSSLYYGQFGLLLLFFFGLYALLFARRPHDLSLAEEESEQGAPRALWDRALVARLLLFAAVAGLLTLPYAGLVLGSVSGPRSVLSQEDLEQRSDGFDPARSTCGVLADLVHPGKNALRERLTETRLVRATYLGVVILGLAAVSLRRRGRFLAALAVGAIFFVLLFLGPRLQVSDGIYCPEPCNLLFLAFSRGFPMFSRIFEPFRLHVLVTLLAALMAAAGFRDLAGSRRSLLLGIVASCLVMGEYLVLSPAPFPLTATELTRPAWCGRLAEDPRPYAVVELPFSYRGGPLFYKLVFYFQTLHGRPMPNGVAFYPPLMEENGVYRELLEHEAHPEAPWDQEGAAAGLAELKAMGFGCLLVHRDAYEPDAWRQVSTFLSRHLGPPVDLGEGVQAYYLP